MLSDDRIEIYDCGRDDIKSGQVDRRVLATLEYLAESGMSPTVTSLKCGHGFYTKSGNVSEHSSGNAVDIAKINGVPILGHQEVGGITEQAVRRLMRLQGTMPAHQVISLLDFGGPTLAMGDHADHIHVGFQARPPHLQAGSVGQPAGPSTPDREPGGAGQALRVLAAGQQEARRRRRLAGSASRTRRRQAPVLARAALPGIVRRMISTPQVAAASRAG